MAVLGDVPPEAVAFDFEVAAASVQHPVAAFDAAIALDTRAAAALAEEGMTLAVPAGEAAETAPAAER